MAIVTYDLLVTARVWADPHLQRHLKPSEVVRAELAYLRLELENLGSEAFPGGQVETLQLASGDAVSSITGLAAVPALPIGGKAVWVERQAFVPPMSGLAWIRVKLQPSDNAGIRYFQAPGTTAMPEWVLPIFVVERLQLATVMLLEELIGKVSATQPE